MDLSSINSLLMEQGLLGAAVLVFGVAVTILYRQTNTLMKERSEIIEEMGSQRIMEVEKRVETVERLYQQQKDDSEQEKEALERRITEAHERNAIMMNHFSEALTLFKQSNERFEESLRRAESTEQKIDKLAWKVDNIEDKIDKIEK